MERPAGLRAPLEGDTPTAAEQLATLIYTSGTTGVPKGVMHNFSSFAFAASRGVELFGTREDDRMLSYLPLCHVAERMFVEMGSLYGEPRCSSPKAWTPSSRT